MSGIVVLKVFIVPALNQRLPSEIARVGFSARTQLPGGFGGPGDGFGIVAVVAKPLPLLRPKNHPQNQQNHQAIYSRRQSNRGSYI